MGLERTNMQDNSNCTMLAGPGLTVNKFLFDEGLSGVATIRWVMEQAGHRKLSPSRTVSSLFTLGPSHPYWGRLRSTLAFVKPWQLKVTNSEKQASNVNLHLIEQDLSVSHCSKHTDQQSCSEKLTSPRRKTYQFCQWMSTHPEILESSYLSAHHSTSSSCTQSRLF